MQTTLTDTPNRTAEPDGVGATCQNCGDQHPLGDRKMNTAITTTCPHCGDTRYTSRALGDTTIKPDNERITDAVTDINGIGDETLQNILDAFPTYYDFLAASKKDLQAIGGVGRKSAQRIIDTR